MSNDNLVVVVKASDQKNTPNPEEDGGGPFKSSANGSIKGKKSKLEELNARIEARLTSHLANTHPAIPYNIY